MQILTTAPEATLALGARLGAALFDGAVVCLHGELGAGKTVLAQGIARGLGVVGVIPSPTYVLVAEYPEARVALRHADLYRLNRPEEADALGLDERVGRDGAWVIEWPEQAPQILPDDRLEVELVRDDTRVRFTFTATGPRHAALLEALAAPGNAAGQPRG